MSIQRGATSPIGAHTRRERATDRYSALLIVLALAGVVAAFPWPLVGAVFAIAGTILVARDWNHTVLVKCCLGAYTLAFMLAVTIYSLTARLLPPLGI